MSASSSLAEAFVASQFQSLAEKLNDNPLKPIIVQISTANSPNQVVKPDLEDDQKHWIVVGICLHRVISPALRQYIPPIVNNIYQGLVKNHQIDKQVYPNHMKLYKPTNMELNYEAINKNKSVPSTKGKRVPYFDYCVRNDVDFTKLFMPTNMAQYSGFNDTCDASALLGMLINIGFPQNVQSIAKKIRADVRNSWAHCNFSDWNRIKYQHSFQLMHQLIPHLKLPAADEKKFKGELNRWQINGIQFLEGTTLGLELFQELKTEMTVLSKYLLEVVDETDDCFAETNRALKAIENSFQAVSDKVSSLDKISNEIKENVKNVEGEIEQIKIKQSDFSYALDETKSDVNKLRTDIDTTQHRHDIDKQAMTEMRMDIVSMKSHLTKSTLDAEETKTKVIYNRTEITNVKRTIEQNQSEIQELKTDVAKTNYDLLQTKSEVENIRTNIDNISHNFSERRQLDKIYFYAPDRMPSVIAREVEIEQLQSVFNKKCDEHHSQVICGLGGIGKTTLSIEYAWRFRSLYPAGVFWMSAESNEALEDSLQRLAIDTETMGNDTKETLHKVLKWISLLQEKWLLIIDNVDTDELHGGIKELVLGSWKRFSKGHVIITSRREAPKAELDFHVKIKYCITLDVLSVSESKEFMIERSGQKSFDNDRSLCELVDELGGLPLALEQAASHIKALKCTYNEYLEKFEKKRLKFLRESKFPVYVAKERRAVITTWQLNFDLIAIQSEEEGIGTAANTAMEIAAYLHSDDIPLCIFNTGSPEILDEDLLDCLCDNVGAKQISEILSRFSLFQGNDIKALSVHRLVQEVIRENIYDVDRQQFVLQCATRMVNRALELTPSPVDAIRGENTGKTSLQLWSKLALNANTVQKYVLAFAEKHNEHKEICFNIETTKLLQASSVYHSLNQRQNEALACQAQMLTIVPAIDISDSTLRDLTCIKIPLLDQERLIIQASMTSNVVRPATASKESSETSEALREEGNKEFKCQKYHSAIHLYSEAARVSKTVDIRVLCNRSLAYLNVFDYENALRDAEKCIDSYRETNSEASVYKAFVWKAYAITNLIRLGQLPISWKSSGYAAAAIAGHLNSRCLMEHKMNVEYPLVRFKVLQNEKELEREIVGMNTVYTTLLLRKGRYEIPRFIFKSIQIVGIEDDVEIASRYVINLCNNPVTLLFEAKYDEQSRIYILMENIYFPSGGEQIQVDGVNVIFSRCKFSNGKKACEDFPRCQGGKGCVNINPMTCKTTYMLAETRRELPAVGEQGHPGIALVGKGTVLVDRCVLDRCGGGGVCCDGKGSVFEIRNSEIRNMRQMGIEARNGGTIIAKNCKILNNQFVGVAVGPRGNGVVTNCVIQGNQEDGIWCGGILTIEASGMNLSSSSDPEGGSQCIVNDSIICHNGYSGISLDGGCYEISGNKIYDNWYWGVMVKSRSATSIFRSDIFENKCGGIKIGFNYSASVVLDGNTIRDHTGPAIHIAGTSEDLNFARNLKVTESMKSLGMIEGEAGLCVIPPFITTRNIIQNNEKGQQHPTEVLNLVQTCCFCHSMSTNLKKCASCKKASYCSRDCQKAHWDRHKNGCKLLRNAYIIEIDMSQTKAVGDFKTFGSTLDPADKRTLSYRFGTQKFIVKINSGKEYTGDNPNKYIEMYDEMRRFDCYLRHRELYHMVRECGVLTHTMFSQKKIYCWASFKNDGRTLCIYTDQLPPLQTW